MMIVIDDILQEARRSIVRRLGKNREKTVQMEPRFEDEFDQMKRKKKYLFRSSDIYGIRRNSMIYVGYCIVRETEARLNKKDGVVGD